jgi:streptogramin lyase
MGRGETACGPAGALSRAVIAIMLRRCTRLVIVGPDRAPWFTDGGQNAIVRVDPVTRAAR